MAKFHLHTKRYGKIATLAAYERKVEKIPISKRREKECHIKLP